MNRGRCLKQNKTHLSSADFLYVKRISIRNNHSAQSQTIKLSRSPSHSSSAPCRWRPKCRQHCPFTCSYTALNCRCVVAPSTPQNVRVDALKCLPRHTLNVTSESSVCMSSARSPDEVYCTTKEWCLSSRRPSNGYNVAAIGCNTSRSSLSIVPSKPISLMMTPAPK